MPLRTSPRKDPYRSFRFIVDGMEAASFSDVSGYDMQIEMVEYREGDEHTTKRKLSGLTKYSNITLKRGVTTDKKLYEWINKIAEKGDVERKSVTITLNDETGAAAASWQIINSWPVKHALTEFKAGGNDVLIESLELAHEGMTRTK